MSVAQDAPSQFAELFRAGRWAEAEVLLRAQLERAPHDPLLLRRLGTVLRCQGRINLSCEILKLAVERNSSLAEAWFELGTSLNRAQRTRDALEAFQRASALRPDWGDAWLNAGVLHDQLGERAAAAAALVRACELQSDCAIARYNLGNVRQNQGDLAGALACYRAALALDPQFGLAHWNLALGLLLTGDYESGWHEYRWRTAACAVALDNYPQPPLTKLEQIPGNTILVHGEQGIGDEILFAGWLGDLTALGARVAFICEPRLRPLFARSFPQLSVYGYQRRRDRAACTVREAIDFQIAAGDLPGLLRREECRYARPDQRLKADPMRVTAWRARFAELGAGPRIGVSWRAGGHPLERQRRSTRLADWRPLLEMRGVTWINLQYGETDRERAEFAAQTGIVIHDFAAGDPLADLDEFAAKLAALDLVISVGNTTVHLAGALGQAACVVLPTIPAWRWLLSGETIPWYPTVRAVRQEAGETWPELFARAAAELPLRFPPLGKLATSQIASNQIRFSLGMEAMTMMNEETKNTVNSNAPGDSRPPLRNSQTPSGPFDIAAGLRRAQELLQAGDAAAAEKLCDEVLSHAPRKPQAWHLLARIAKRTERWDLALRSLERAVAVADPDFELRQELAELRLATGNAAAAIELFGQLARDWPERVEGWLGLGLSARAAGELPAALEALEHAREVAPNNPKAYNFLGGVLSEMNRAAEAITAFRRAVELAPNYLSALNNLGCVHHQQGEFPAAARCFEQVLAADPNHASAAANLREIGQFAAAKAAPGELKAAPGTSHTATSKSQSKIAGPGPAPLLPAALQSVLEQSAQLFNQEQYDDAAKLADQVIAQTPDHAVALRIVGVAQRRRGELPAAIQTLRRAIAAEPRSFALFFELGVCYLDQHAHQEAYDCFIKVLERKPDFQPCYVNLSGIMEQQERYEEATEWARRAVQVAPGCALAHYNLGNSLREQGLIEQAINAYADSLRHDPKYARAHWNLGICNLHLGNYAAGWQGYEMRGEVGEVDWDLYPQPRWNGESLAGKTIVVHAEQGLGDEIVFCSCLPELLPLAAKVIIICEPRLEKLFRRSFPTTTVYGYLRRKDRLPFPLREQVDYQLPMGSLPLYFRKSRAEFPRREKFLTPDPQLIAQWRERFATLGDGIKVGISWRAGGKPLERRKRSILVGLWRDLLLTPGAKFVNLQYGDSSEDADEIERLCGVTLHDWEQGDPLIDVDSFAAKIAALDLVISVGNATVHMAGAVGTPAWTLLPMIPSWRWMIRGAESPWYKTVRLFRQPERHQWEPVLNALARMLRHTASAPAAQRRELTTKIPSPPISKLPTAPLKPLTEHAWLDHTQFSAMATVEQIPQTMEQAKAAYELGEYDRAERLLRSVLQIAPKFPAALHCLGLVALKQGRTDLAIRSMQRALSVAEMVPQRRCDLALALVDAKRYDEAIACYERALELNPNFIRAEQELAELRHKLKPNSLAAPLPKDLLVEKAAKAEPPPSAVIAPASIANSVLDSADPHAEIFSDALSAAKSCRIDRAIDLLEGILRVDPGHVAAHELLAEVYCEDQAWDLAERHLTTALSLRPTLAALLLLARIAEERGNSESAISLYRAALEQAPDSLLALIRLGTLLLEQGDAAGTETLFRRALPLRGDARELVHSLGLAVAEQGRNAEALTLYNQALAISGQRPYPPAHANRAFALLRQGDYINGWNEYEWRWQCPDAAQPRAQFAAAPWNGESLTGKSILIHAEQGLGDEIMFATCYPDVLATAQRVLITCEPRLETLFRRAFPAAKIFAVTRGTEHLWKLPGKDRVDYQIAAGSLPRLLRQRLAAFPAQERLLTADQALRAEWRLRFAALGSSRKIGLSWQAGTKPKDRLLRCLEFRQLQDLLALPNIQWINLQHGVLPSELHALATESGISLHDWPEFDLRNDLENLAARISACDAVVSVGNTVVHLAGALGVPTWGLVPAHGGWRWGSNEQTAPWYRSARIIRPRKAGNWDTAIARVRQEVQSLIAQQRSEPGSNSSIDAPTGTPAAKRVTEQPAREAQSLQQITPAAVHNGTSPGAPPSAPHFASYGLPAANALTIQPPPATR